jgi:hypothetical protein
VNNVNQKPGVGVEPSSLSFAFSQSVSPDRGNTNSNAVNTNPQPDQANQKYHTKQESEVQR